MAAHRPVCGRRPTKVARRPDGPFQRSGRAVFRYADNGEAAVPLCKSGR